ncbi:unnamed protein product [Adineta steineri]|uniref:G-protein coupled receptors family 1 profile domain-containing protein n=1 Tax=Adineta steineri TaxID=433720 RepID=A0A818WWU4_9BILA|nr:unnamed protein product [Adineta steineri]CAF3730684.1 unnamed protein product [Adineta steineri]
MSVVDTLSLVQQYLSQYGITTYLILGSIGLFLNIAYFTQPAYRDKSFSLYIVTMSICGLLGLHISTVPIIYALYNPDPLTYNAFFCAIQFYLRHSFNELMRTFFVLACADRYASSSTQAKIRRFSQYKVAIRVIPSVLLFWFIVSIFPTVMRTLDKGVCDARSRVIHTVYAIYILLSLGIFPLTGSSVFAILLIKNMKSIRQRIHPTITLEPEPHNLRKRDRDMLRMLLVELVGYILTTIPNTVKQIYKSAAANVVKTKDRLAIENFTTYLGQIFLLYLINTLSFWVFLSASQTYRTELKNMLIRWYRFITRQRINQ